MSVVPLARRARQAHVTRRALPAAPPGVSYAILMETPVLYGQELLP